MKQGGSLVLTVVLADNSRKHIPAEWTDLRPASMEDMEANLSAAIGSLADLLRARVYVNHLLERMRQ
jgi:hypothetical protein